MAHQEAGDINSKELPQGSFPNDDDEEEEEEKTLPIVLEPSSE